MADLQKLLFEIPAKVTDKEILATARLNARVKVFAGRELADDIAEEINEAIADETDRLIAEGVLKERPDWLAVAAACLVLLICANIWAFSKSSLEPMVPTAYQIDQMPAPAQHAVHVTSVRSI